MVFRLKYLWYFVEGNFNSVKFCFTPGSYQLYYIPLADSFNPVGSLKESTHVWLSFKDDCNAAWEHASVEEDTFIPGLLHVGKVLVNQILVVLVVLLLLLGRVWLGFPISIVVIQAFKRVGGLVTFFEGCGVKRLSALHHGITCHKITIEVVLFGSIQETG